MWQTARVMPLSGHLWFVGAHKEIPHNPCGGEHGRQVDVFTWEICQYLAQCVLENKITSSKLSVVKSYLLSLPRVSMKGAHNHIGTWEGDWDSTGCCRSFPNSFWLFNRLCLQQGKLGRFVFWGREWS